ncbi:MAG: aminoglycoside phosphotransferase family protein [Desulfotignum balticum]|jgi:aminoglycoside phosphotransferase (APT) family kinase protein|uniref:Aminoglycoside phosphotransferase family protein n=1 Tax=Desulfotignum balticum TaxID=115781 RepID=A0A931CV86_9BACT|nr:aminoglycoside phosphotransferase family protein [Desulfotignum balticum]
MPDTDRLEQIQQFLTDAGWVSPPFRVSFLAAGEYNANYRVDSNAGPCVLRINHGSQLGLGDDQIAYEFNVLTALADSGVTPKPLACHPHPDPLGGGALLMTFVPGTPLDYTRDLDTAARIFARVHTTCVPDGLIVQADPVNDIARESHGLIHRFADHPMKKEKKQILAYYDTVLALAETTRPLFEAEPLCLVNTEVNSGNFLISPDRACLVDWEKAVVSCRYQDLGHFMVPTTTLWKTDILLTPADKKTFLQTYHQQACPDMPFADLVEKSHVMEKTILLRALSWCFMAWYEYTHTNRPIRNPDTFAKIQQYLSDIPWILHSVT